MSKELVPSAKFWEGSWVGQFRAVDKDRARLFAQAVSNAMAELGVEDVGFSVRLGSGEEFSDEDARVTLTEPVPKDVLHESVPHEEVRRQLREARKEIGDGDE